MTRQQKQKIGATDPRNRFAVYNKKYEKTPVHKRVAASCHYKKRRVTRRNTSPWSLAAFAAAMTNRRQKSIRGWMV